MTITRLGQLTAELRTLADVQLYGGGSTQPSISSTKVRTGGYSYANNTVGQNFGPYLAAYPTAARMGCWINHNGASAGYTPTLALVRIGNGWIKLLWSVNANEFRLVLGYNQGTSNTRLVATAPAGAFATVNTWFHVGLTVKYGASGFVSLYIDGALVLTYVGDTRVYASGQSILESGPITGMFVLGFIAADNWTATAYIDDLFVDAYEGEVDAPVPAKRFLFGLANAAGGAAQWTPVGAATNIACVDENPNTGDTDYVKALVAAKRDLYNCSDITVPTDYVIRAAIPVVVARKGDSAVDSQVKLAASDGSNVTLGGGKQPATAYTVVWDRFTTRPDGNNWDETSFNAMQFGIESAGQF